MPTRSSGCSRPACRSGPNCGGADARGRTWLVCARAVLDPLGLVEHDQVELQPELGDELAIARAAVRSWRSSPAYRLAATASAAWPGRLRSPSPAARAPSGQTRAASWSPAAWGRRTARCASSPACSSSRIGRDGLHRFAQAHLVGQDGGVARIEKGDRPRTDRETDAKGNASEPSPIRVSSDGCNT